ncbi:MAG TPA: cation-transporting P-type ATPase, partial [Methylomirabilota bacterium]|nr:cation-transporting P-type ATPase [Methylomirabilota bacterium]
MTGRSVPHERVPRWPDDASGLLAGDAADRLRRYGPNAIVESPPRPWADVTRDTARDPMIWFLAAAAALYALVGQIAEALTLLAAVVPLVGMDAFLHRRTRASTAGLAGRLATRARVVRDGAVVEVPSLDVVPGDLVVVGAGEPVPADGLVVAGEDLKADESTLTGEAYPVAKRPLTIEMETPTRPPRARRSARPGEAVARLDVPQGVGAEVEEMPVAGEHWMLAGTRLLTGRSSVRVVFTGAETLYGEIVRSATGARARTPLQHAIERLVSVLIGAAGVVCLALAAVRLTQGHGWVDALVSAVTLASAALPEEFPVVFTLFLAVGVYRLARRQALVRRPVSVETIGRVTTICTDKTGTLTEGRLVLTHLLPAAGAGEARLLALGAAACRADGGDPLDAALLGEAARRGVVAPGRVRERVPFTEARAREAVLLEEGAETLWVVKGAPERVLAAARLAGTERDAWSERVAALAASGHKVIACAWRPHSGPPPAEPEDDYQLAGLLAFEDPVRKGVAAAVAECREAEIHTMMVTGDHPLTAGAVARELGLGGGAPVVVSGGEIDALTAGGETAALRRIDVVARAVPAQKLALVRALQAAGEVVAVTGDGVNDVPALQAADVGIAMGERGTRPAREVAAIVLLDDDFGTIVRAIAEGRQLFRNLKM